jgi:aminopeptidase N
MSAFVDRPGVPLVNAEVRCAGAKESATVTQTSPANTKVAPVPWTIPVCVKPSSGQITCEVVEKRSATVPLDSCPAWLLSNANGRGYYRMLYSPDMLRKVGAAVGSLAPAERIALLSDEWALVRAGRHDVGSFLDLASGFGAERDPAVVATLAGPLDFIGDYLATGDAKAQYAMWVAALLKPGLEDVGWTGSPSEPEDRRELRARLLATLGKTAHDSQVAAHARDLVIQELAKPGAVDGALLDAVLPIAARNGDADLYVKYLARSQSAKDPEDHDRYVNALTKFSDPVLVKRTLDYILGPDVRSQDAKLLIAGLLTDRAVQSLAWQLLQARWDEVQKKTGEFVGNTVIVGALAAFCDTKTLGDVRRFFAIHKVPDAERTLQQSIERISACIRLHDTQHAKLAAWLRRAGV